MTVFNIELEDGEKPVSFTLNKDDGERFIAFMAECTEYKKALALLVEVKDHKDAHGRDDWYLGVQPIAWTRARKALV